MTLSDRLRQSMTAAGISQAELARACRVKPPSVHGWLSGKAKYLRGENLLRAAKALDVSDDWLATGCGPRERSSKTNVLQEETAPYEAYPIDAASHEVMELWRGLDPGNRRTARAILRALHAAQTRQ